MGELGCFILVLGGEHLNDIKFPFCRSTVIKFAESVFFWMNCVDCVRVDSSCVMLRQTMIMMMMMLVRQTMIMIRMIIMTRMVSLLEW